MQRTSDELWISLGAQDHHKLRFAMACGVEGPITLFEFQNDCGPDEPIEVGTDVLVYFNGSGGFLQQAGQVVSSEHDGDAVPYGLEMTGEAVSAENREMYRASTVFDDYTATVDEAEGKIADVSVLGLAVITEETFEVGKVVTVAFELEGEAFAGRCCVKGASECRGGTRHGLMCIDGSTIGNLESGLRKLTMVAQRSKLKRLSRAG